MQFSLVGSFSSWRRYPVITNVPRDDQVAVGLVDWSHDPAGDTYMSRRTS
jgi:hypothetical protein